MVFTIVRRINNYFILYDLEQCYLNGTNVRGVQRVWLAHHLVGKSATTAGSAANNLICNACIECECK